MDKKWTPRQDAAIHISSGTLVSAAAGSGKTAVLVERIIDRITCENPISADRLLVVTFTKAAAKEMKTRIEQRLDEECRKNPTGELLKQRIKIKNAKICTIDSFCNDLIKENFDRLDISPDFSIGDDGALLTLSEKAMKRALDEAYAEKTDDFLLLLEALGGDYDEGSLRDNIKTICYKSDNMPFAREYIEGLIEKNNSEEVFINAKQKILDTVSAKLTSAVKRLTSFLQFLNEDEVLKKAYGPCFEDDIRGYCAVIELCNQYDYDGVFEALKSFSWERLGTSSACQDKELSEAAKKARDYAKGLTKSMAELVGSDEATAFADFEYARRVLGALLKLTLSYYDKYFALRRENNVMTFSDTEHYALSLVCRYENGEIKIRDDADDIIERFDEVLVDEYQDTNDMQDRLFAALSDNGKKIFIVGDIKQSIYGFRGANPAHFAEKMESYVKFDEAIEDELKKISLSSNFRSRKGICDFVNFLFSVTMNGENSSLQYTEEEKLNFAAKYPENDETQVEISFVSTPSTRSTRNDDARNVAEYILETMKNSFVTDKQTKALRRPQFSDFAVIMREISSSGQIYAEVFRNAGIPVTYNNTDFLKRTEVNLLLSLLSVIENRTRDIELISVMMSPVFSFTADELAEIRLANRGSNIFAAVSASAAQGNKKCEEFLNLIRYFKVCSISMSISELITEIFDQTDMLNIVSVLNDGDARRKNLLTIQKMASDYEASGFSKSISLFTDYLKRMAEKMKSNNAANTNAVRIMTIHESKGLQFPICIIANSVRPFSNSDSSASLLLDNEFGAALRFNDENAVKKKSYITLKAILQNAEKAGLDEELRLLYVALTRAEEKLFISVTGGNAEEFIGAYSIYAKNSENLENYLEYTPEFGSFADIIRFAIMLHPDIRFARDKSGSHGLTLDTESHIKITFKDKADIVLPENENSDKAEEPAIDTGMASEIEDGIKFVYPYENIRDIESKAAVAIIANKADERDFSFTSKPAFMFKSGLDSAKRGTATHRFMQFCDFEKASVNIEAEADRLYEYEYITQNERNAVYLDEISEFFKSELYGRIKNSDRVEREMRFLTEMKAGFLNSELPQSVSGEQVVVQGSVDCVFVENGQIVVVDFKTDRVKTPEQLSKPMKFSLIFMPRLALKYSKCR
ncbi:MAG: helicase-exonuclease AddAB subunit AddA [Clostridiales bacterium]|nr:helicase-exonuclease AddAB subunit AddA [Candidatus Equinaster intestinalis]